MAEARRARPLLGTLVEIHAVAPMDSATLSAAIESAFAAITEVHRLMSVHEPASEASRLNREAHRQAVRISPGTRAVLEAALRFSAASEGAFDLVVGARLQALGLLPTMAGDPADTTACWRDIELVGSNEVRFHRPMRLDFGGIAKGYAVDCAAARLREAGVTSALVNAGGDLRVIGAQAQRIEIRDAREPLRSAHSLALTEQAVATSGTYFSAKRDQDGQAFSALIDPRSGSAYGGTDSVSVIAGDCMTADALTKIVLFAPEALSAALLERYDAQAIIQRVPADGAQA